MLSCSSLFISAYFVQATLACIPMDPGEELPCPSVPAAILDDLEKAIPGYEVFPDLLELKEENGAMVYTCKDTSTDFPYYPFPLNLIAIAGGVGMEYADGSDLRCRANSGRFVVYENDVDKPIDNKKIGCGFDCTSCKADSPQILDHEKYENCMNRGDDFKCTGKPMTYSDTAGGCSVLECLQDTLVVMTKDKKKYVLVPFDVAICASEQWLSPFIKLPEDMVGYVCAKECVSCLTDPTHLIEPTENVCSQRGDNIVCSAKPTRTNENGCTVMTCTPKSSLVVLYDTYHRVIDSLVCSFGEWPVDTEGSKGLACAQGCDMCPVPVLLDTLACSGFDASLKCGSKPTIDMNSNNCLTIQCGAGEVLFSLDSKGSERVYKAVCASKKWTFDPESDRGYACVKV